MAEQEYDLMHKDDVVASLQLDDLSGAILKVTPGTNSELLPLGGSQGADSPVSYTHLDVYKRQV